jgi:hypothetical protein
MAAPEYHFSTNWCFDADINEVADILSDAPGFAAWWPAVYLEVNELERGHPETRVGALIELYTRGWLPYTLRWQCRVTEAAYPHGFTLEAWGDFIGRGCWRLEQHGPVVFVQYDWRVRAGKPLLRRLSWLLRPAFEANHHWAMRTGEESLRLELARRRATSPEGWHALPAPPRGMRWPGRRGTTI